jgi:DNA-binding SARP family transcriptional activator
MFSREGIRTGYGNSGSGQRGAALRQYPICRRALAKELGVEPSEETRALYERILSGDDPLLPY